MRKLLFALFCLAVTPAFAMGPCAQSDQLREALGNSKFKEHFTIKATVTNNGEEVPIEIWTSDTGTYSILVFPTPDIGCFLISGKGWPVTM